MVSRSDRALFRTEPIKQTLRFVAVITFAGVMALNLQDGSDIAALTSGVIMLLLIWEIPSGWKRMEDAETPSGSTD